MGLLTGLLTLPLAPVRGVARIAEVVAAEADRQLYEDETTIRHDLAELQRAAEFGELDADEYTEREEALIAQLARLRSRGAE